MKYHFKVHREKNNGYWAECLELQGCATQGETLKDLRRNMKEALNLYLSEPEDSKLAFPMPNKALARKRNVERVSVEPNIGLAVKLKSLRLEKNFTQQKLAELLNMPRVYSYQRLESGDANPELKTLARLKKVYGDDLEIDEILEVD